MPALSSSTEPASDVLAVPVKEAARRLGVSPETVYRLLKAGELSAKKIGTRTVIETSVLADYIAKQPVYTGAV